MEYRSATTAARGDKDFNKAEKFALEAIEKYPTDALPAYFLATEIYAGKNSPKKDYNKAAEFFKKAIEMDNQTEEDQKLEEPIISQDEDGNLKQLLTIKEGIDYYSYSLWAEAFNKGIELGSIQYSALRMASKSCLKFALLTDLLVLKRFFLRIDINLLSSIK